MSKLRTDKALTSAAFSKLPKGFPKPEDFSEIIAKALDPTLRSLSGVAPLPSLSKEHKEAFAAWLSNIIVEIKPEEVLKHWKQRFEEEYKDIPGWSQERLEEEFRRQFANAKLLPYQGTYENVYSAASSWYKAAELGTTTAGTIRGATSAHAIKSTYVESGDTKVNGITWKMTARCNGANNSLGVKENAGEYELRKMVQIQKLFTAIDQWKHKDRALDFALLQEADFLFNASGPQKVSDEEARLRFVLKMGLQVRGWDYQVAKDEPQGSVKHLAVLYNTGTLEFKEKANILPLENGSHTGFASVFRYQANRQAIRLTSLDLDPTHSYKGNLNIPAMLSADTGQKVLSIAGGYFGRSPSKFTGLIAVENEVTSIGPSMAPQACGGFSVSPGSPTEAALVVESRRECFVEDKEANKYLETLRKKLKSLSGKEKDVLSAEIKTLEGQKHYILQETYEVQAHKTLPGKVWKKDKNDDKAVTKEEVGEPFKKITSPKTKPKIHRDSPDRSPKERIKDDKGKSPTTSESPSLRKKPDGDKKKNGSPLFASKIKTSVSESSPITPKKPVKAETEKPTAEGSYLNRLMSQSWFLEESRKTLLGTQEGIAEGSPEGLITLLDSNKEIVEEQVGILLRDKLETHYGAFQFEKVDTSHGTMYSNPRGRVVSNLERLPIFPDHCIMATDTIGAEYIENRRQYLESEGIKQVLQHYFTESKNVLNRHKNVKSITLACPIHVPGHYVGLEVLLAKEGEKIDVELHYTNTLSPYSLDREIEQKTREALHQVFGNKLGTVAFGAILDAVQRGVDCGPIIVMGLGNTQPNESFLTGEYKGKKCSQAALKAISPFFRSGKRTSAELRAAVAVMNRHGATLTDMELIQKHIKGFQKWIETLPEGYKVGELFPGGVIFNISLEIKNVLENFHEWFSRLNLVYTKHRGELIRCFFNALGHSMSIEQADKIAKESQVNAEFVQFVTTHVLEIQSKMRDAEKTTKSKHAEIIKHVDALMPAEVKEAKQRLSYHLGRLTEMEYKTCRKLVDHYDECVKKCNEEFRLPTQEELLKGLTLSPEETEWLRLKWEREPQQNAVHQITPEQARYDLENLYDTLSQSAIEQRCAIIDKSHNAALEMTPEQARADLQNSGVMQTLSEAGIAERTRIGFAMPWAQGEAVRPLTSSATAPAPMGWGQRVREEAFNVPIQPPTFAEMIELTRLSEQQEPGASQGNGQRKK
ncbi:MAG: hypothetical protein K0R63_123 [Rickettsiales bacterium]|jgi:hypothetical protein|nr:hypothetical protein [Rickettsiales bacterium]